MKVAVGRGRETGLHVTVNAFFQVFVDEIMYKIRGNNGKPMAGQGKLNFLESKYKEPKKIKTFDFGKYSDGVTTASEDEEDTKTKKKFDIKNLDFIDERNEFNPIQTDTTDSNYLFDNEDAIIVNLKNKKK